LYCISEYCDAQHTMIWSDGHTKKTQLQCASHLRYAPVQSTSSPFKHRTTCTTTENCRRQTRALAHLHVGLHWFVWTSSTTTDVQWLTANRHHQLLIGNWQSAQAVNFHLGDDPATCGNPVLVFLVAAEYSDTPNFCRLRKNFGRRKRRRIWKTRLAAAKLRLSLPFWLSLKLYNLNADFKRGIWVCLRDGSTPLGMFPQLTELARMQLHFIYCFTDCWKFHRWMHV